MDRAKANRMARAMQMMEEQDRRGVFTLKRKPPASMGGRPARSRPVVMSLSKMKR